MARKMASKKDFCAHCEGLVTKRNRAFACDNCNLWVHLKCTAFTLKVYQEVVKGDSEVDFVCNRCVVSVPDLSLPVIGVLILACICNADLPKVHVLFKLIKVLNVHKVIKNV